MIITLHGERPMSWNKFYSGGHWAKRKGEADRVHMAVRAAIDPNTCGIIWNQVRIVITAYFDKRPLDPDNVCAKLYIDGLCGWIINDDTMKHIDSVTTRSRIDRKRPRVEIEVIEVRQ